ncbi:Fe-S cluster assembly protein SufD [Kordiimonas pumila]|uniref:Fe-S cluster assembly protein SufD n=1 Tax=Kordiimonas pumila TaxID=2161677 RepID=A0ABV7D6A3_9PROT|nr:Fe-S cluster assembly protein SufD [Kordiimonas pumila]
MDQHIIEGYKTQLDSLLGTVPGTDPLRLSAMKEFADKAFPTAKTENWRYSDIRSLNKDLYALAQPAPETPDLPDALSEVAARFVFVNGRYDETLSDLGDLWQAMPIRSLSNHFMSNPDRAGELVRGIDSVSLLNTALLRDGMVFSIPTGVEIDDPIEIIHIMTGTDKSAGHVRHVVELGEQASATIVEHFIGTDAHYWTNSLLQARVNEGAKLRHIHLQEEGKNAIHTAKAFVYLGAEADYQGTSIALGGKTSRFEVHARILADGAHAAINGVALAATGQSHDMLTQVEHTVPNATSDQVFRTVADSQGKTSFQGKIIVAKDAQKTEANQSFKALVFDKTAEANAKPELEILADDVKCSHGATVGQLDEKAIFYLTSRGIDPVTARQMLVEAFTTDALTTVGNADIEAALMARITGWMSARADKASLKAAADK